MYGIIAGIESKIVFIFEVLQQKSIIFLNHSDCKHATLFQYFRGAHPRANNVDSSARGQP